MQGYEYVKAVLYVYPILTPLAEAVSKSAENKAYLSFRTENTLSCAEKITEDIAHGALLRELNRQMRSLLTHFTEEEAYLLEYKYFRRGAELNGRFAGLSFSGSEREYYRRQNALLKKTAGLLAVRGVTERTFLRDYAGIQPFPRIYRALKEGRELLVVPKRKTQKLRCGQNSASCGAGAFLPRSRNTAIAQTAATVRQIMTICSAEGEEETGSSATSSGSDTAGIR